MTFSNISVTSPCNTGSAALPGCILVSCRGSGITCTLPLTLVAGRQQHPGAEGREGHLLQPTVSAAVTVQLSQVAAQVAAKLPAARLGDAHRPQRSAVLHRPQQQNHHLGERSKVWEAGTESVLH